MPIAVLDIDGVVADVNHRVSHIEGRYQDWAAFFLAASEDTPLPEGVALARELAGTYEVVWLTGRPEWIRNETIAWLDTHVLPGAELFMRANRDRRSARRYKLGALRDLAPRGIAAFVDDDEDVIAGALQAGYPAVRADWAPRPRALRLAQDRLGRT